MPCKSHVTGVRAAIYASFLTPKIKQSEGLDR
jgi:hypothetical protein